jgi:hypothetical protein
MGVTGSFVHCYATEELTQAAYKEAVDGGEVVQVTHIVSK